MVRLLLLGFLFASLGHAAEAQYLAKRPVDGQQPVWSASDLAEAAAFTSALRVQRQDARATCDAAYPLPRAVTPEQEVRIKQVRDACVAAKLAEFAKDYQFANADLVILGAN